MKDIETEIKQNVLEIIKIIKNEYPGSPSLEKTKLTIKEFQKSLKIISDPKIPLKNRQALARKVMPIQRAVKTLKGSMPENKFFLFYKNAIEGQSIKSLSIDYGVDTKTVRRARNLAYKQLSVLLYPDLVIGEIFIVGW
ncbi:hypothetical protein F8154_08925 [Alkaliphilus pronyensis]|uniref:Uncharacterized protein n=1 Tax=Alkaliphilus pronyensis TaxID=1482732 RepID=A0A6I0FAA0_9FIRM|nr:hypothetical protein [Alkaliphilus pronyensis]KAB3534417.1 hypothetical protein F8154_08925 [Alkaliphilus pronyensis]